MELRNRSQRLDLIDGSNNRGIRIVPLLGRGQPKQASSGSRPLMFLVFNVLDLTAAPSGRGDHPHFRDEKET